MSLMIRLFAWLVLASAVLTAAESAGWGLSGITAISLLTLLLTITNATGWRLGRVGLTVSPNPARPGRPMMITVEITPRRSLQLGRVLLGLKAHRSGAGGVQTLLNRTYELTEGLQVIQNTAWKRVMQVDLPEEIPPSGAGTDGQIVWLVTLDVALPGWPDYYEVQPLEVSAEDSRASSLSETPARRKPAGSLLPAPGCLALIHLPLLAVFLMLAANRPPTIWRQMTGTPLRVSTTEDVPADTPIRVYVRMRLLDYPGTKGGVRVRGSANDSPFERVLQPVYPERGQPYVMGQLTLLRRQASQIRLMVSVQPAAQAPRAVAGEIALVPTRMGWWPLAWFIASFVCGAAFWVTLSIWIWKPGATSSRTPLLRAGGPVLIGFLIYVSIMGGLAFWLRPFPWPWMW